MRTASAGFGWGGGYAYSTKAISVSDVVESERGRVQDFEKDSYGLGFKSIYYSPDGLGRYDQLVFRTAEQAEYFNGLPDGEAKRNFLIMLANQRIAAIVSQPEIQTGLDLFANPFLMESLKSLDVVEAIHAMSLIKGIVDHTARVIAEHAPLPGTGRFNYPEANEAAKTVIRSVLAEKNPALRVIDFRRDSFRDRIVRMPLEFVLFMDHLPSSEKRGVFMHEVIGFVDGSGQDPDLQLRAHREIIKTLANRRLIGVGQRPGRKPMVVEVSLVDRPASSAPATESEKKDGERGGIELAGQKGKKKKKTEYSDDSPAPYRVSPEAMIDFVLQYAPERWTPALAREFRKLNRDGRYDVEFLDHYYLLNQTYPPSERVFNNPQMSGHLEEMKMHMMHMMEKEGAKLARDIYFILQDILKRRQSQVASLGN